MFQLDESAYLSGSDAVVVHVQSCVEVLSLWGTSCVREMGSDARCVLRSVLYAAMLDNHSILQTCGNLNDCCQVSAYPQFENSHFTNFRDLKKFANF